MFESKHPPETPRWVRALYHLPNYGRLVRRLWSDPRVPIYRKGIPVLFGAVCLFVGLLYFASRVDLVLDFFPFVGKLDDLVLLLLALFAPGGWLFIRLSPPEIVAEHVAAIDEANRRRGRL